MNGARLRGEWLRLCGALKEGSGAWATMRCGCMASEIAGWVAWISCAVVRRTRVPERSCAAVALTVRADRGEASLAAVTTSRPAVRPRRIV
jgi:hypothetical protein